MSAQRDMEACRAAIRTGSLSFHAASRLLPAHVRDPALVLYAFCRLADDAVDEGHDPSAAVLHLQSRLDNAYAGTPRNDAIDRAFARMIEQHAMPRALPDALLEGLAWDAEGRRFDSLSGVLDYSARVAAVVGAMMCVLMGVRDRHRLARACDLGLAMQLTNIARDIGEDAQRGRIYLPLDWFEEAGVSPRAFLRDPNPSPEIRAMTARLLREADRLYLRSEPGIARLPITCRPGIFAARSIYGGIGKVIRTQACDAISRRATTGKARKVGWLATAALRAGLTVMQPTMATLYARPCREAAFLVSAATQETQRFSRSETLITALARLRAQDIANRERQTGLDRRSA